MGSAVADVDHIAAPGSSPVAAPVSKTASVSACWGEAVACRLWKEGPRLPDQSVVVAMKRMPTVRAKPEGYGGVSAVGGKRPALDMGRPEEALKPSTLHLDACGSLETWLAFFTST